MIMDSSKNGKWIVPFKKFSMVRVNFTWLTIFLAITQPKKSQISPYTVIPMKKFYHCYY